MFKSEVNAGIRSEIGSKSSRRIRDKGQIPGVVYGQHRAPKTLEVDRTELDNIIRKYGSNAMLDLHLGTNAATVMLKDVQRNPVTKEIIHVDFQEISQNELVHTMVPIKLVGRGRVESSESVVQQQLREIHIECLPNDIPTNIEVDVSLLSPGHPLRIADVEFGQELSVINDPQEIIAALAKAQRAEEKTEEDNGLLEKIMVVSKKEIESR